MYSMRFCLCHWTYLSGLYGCSLSDEHSWRSTLSR